MGLRSCLTLAGDSACMARAGDSPRGAGDSARGEGARTTRREVQQGEAMGPDGLQFLVICDEYASCLWEQIAQLSPVVCLEKLLMNKVHQDASFCLRVLVILVQ